MKTQTSTNPQISSREKEVLHLIAHEYTIDMIADELFISTHTVVSHRKNLLQKLNVKNMAGMVRRGFELRYLMTSVLMMIIYVSGFSFSSSLPTNPTWNNGVVEQSNGCSWMWMAVATDNNGNFFAVYQALPSSNANHYKLVSWNGSAWSQISSFQESDISGLSGFSDDVQMEIDGNGHFHIVFRGYNGSGTTSERGVWYAKYNGSSWSFTKIETYTDPNGWKSANDPTISLDNNNRPHLSWEYSNANGQREYTIKYASFNGSNWNIEDAYTQTGHSNEVKKPDIEIDGNGKAHIAFERETNGSGLDGRLAYITNTTGSWVVTEVVTGTQGNIAGVGSQIELYNGHAYIAHTRGDHNAYTINLATNEGGSWTDAVISSGGDQNHRMRDFEMNSNGLMFISFELDVASDSYKYAYKESGGSWSLGTIATQSPAGDVANYTSSAVNNSGLVMTTYMNFINSIDGHCNPGNSRQLDYATTQLGTCSPQTWYIDADEDNYGSSSVSQCNRPQDGKLLSELANGSTGTDDCNDNNMAINPGAQELPCDNIDNNCDTNTDENRVDADGDTFDECVDCNDNDNSINPAAPELPCDNLDNNCDTNIDENRVDADGDTFDECVDCNDNNAAINPAAAELPCDGSDNNCDTNIDENRKDSDGDTYDECVDCNDNNAAINPGAVELPCDGVDNNCDTNTDENRQDADNDTYDECMDCNDNNSAIHPNATEVCNGVDDNCNTQTDEGVTSIWHPDTDGDGFGNGGINVEACNAPSNHVSDGSDCDDNDANEKPGQTWYIDADGDNYGSAMVTQCLRPNNGKLLSELANGSTGTDDCNDNNSAINPSASEVCNGGIDDDCNPSTIENCCPSSSKIFVDASVSNSGNGSSWLMAIDDLQDAIDMACTCSIDTVWIADGTYIPSLDTLGNVPADERDATFYFDKSMVLYGGFEGNESRISERNIHENKSIISGEIGHSDTESDNIKTLVTTKDVGNSFVMDGIYIEDATGENFGAWYNRSSGLSMISSPKIHYCTFQRNSGMTGGAFSNRANGGVAIPVFTSCNFQFNSAISGGAIDNTSFTGASLVKVYNSRFYQNSSELGGAIIGVGQAVSFDIYGSTFVENQAFVNEFKSDNEVYNKSRTGEELGAAVALITAADMDMTDCIVWDNGSTISDNFHINGDANELTLTNCLIPYSSCPQGATCYGDNLFGMNPLFKDQISGDLNLSECSPAINAGSGTGALMHDINGHSRPAHSHHDIGAYERQEQPGEMQTWYKDKDGDGYTDGMDSVSCLQPTDYYSLGDLTGYGCTSLFFDDFETGDLSKWTSTVPYKSEILKSTDCSGTLGAPLNTLSFVNGADVITPNDGSYFFGSSMFGDCLPAQLIHQISIPEGTSASLSFQWILMYAQLTNQSERLGVKVSIRPLGGSYTTLYNGELFNKTDHSSRLSDTWHFEEIDLSAYMGGDWEIKVQFFHHFYEVQYGLDDFVIEYCANEVDCNDMNDEINPGVAEICNGIDDNCNSQTDEGVLTTWHPDSDGDGFGDGHINVEACNAPPNHVADGSDCDDNDANEKPGQRWYIDSDGDNYGGQEVIQCLRPDNGKLLSELANGSTGSDDCNDNDPNINPAMSELCNGVDDDCDFDIDEGFRQNHVTNTNDDHCGSLRFAIENAMNGDTITFDPSIDGDTIKLTYGEIDINKNLVIIGNDTTNTIIDARYFHRIFEIRSGNTVEITGIKFQRGFSNEQGGAIENDGTLSIKECLFEKNITQNNMPYAIDEVGNSSLSKARHSQNGGAIYSDGDFSLQVANSTFRGNFAQQEGGAIWVSDDHWSVKGCNFMDNDANSDAGAIYNDGNQSGSIEDSHFYNNTSQSEGGALFNYYSDSLFIQGCSFIHNIAIIGGAISTEAEVHMEVSNSLFKQNMATSFNWNFANKVTKSQVTLSTGGAISGDGDDKVYIFDNVDFKENMADAHGGAIYSRSSSDKLILTNCEISSNSISLGGGSGGGIYTRGELSMNDCQVLGNSSTDDGGGIYSDELLMRQSRVSGNSGAGEFGGGILMQDGYIINSIISGNSGVDQGGGVICMNDVTIVNTTITGNHSIQTGGGIENQGTLNLVNSIVAKNIDTEGSPNIFNSGNLSGMHNLIGDGSGQVDIVHDQDGNQVGTNAQFIDPMFVNDVPANDSLGGNFQLLCGSVALDSGTVDTTGLMLGQVDFNGNNRIFGINIDIGALELQNVCNDLEIIGSSVVCPGQSDEVYHTNMSQEQCNSATFNWILNGTGMTILSGQGTHNITAGFDNGTINAELILESTEGTVTEKDTMYVVSAPPVICNLSGCVDSSHLSTGVLLSAQVPDIFNVNRVITSDAIIFNKDFTFRAGQEIILQPGFEVNDGRELIADIMPCINSGSLTDDNVKFILKKIEEFQNSKKNLIKNLTCPLDIDNDNICDDVDDCLDFDGDGYGIGIGCNGVDCLDNDATVPSEDADCDGISTDKDCDDMNLQVGKCDSDGDGIPDDEDNCPNIPNVSQSDSDSNGIGDICQPTPRCGTSACSDGDPCTVNDQWDEDCNCIGTYKDSDDDGVCDFYDRCEGYDDNRDWDSDGTPDGCDADPACSDCEVDDNGKVTICWIPFIEDNMKTVVAECDYLEKFFDEEGRMVGRSECGPCECSMIGDVDTDGDGVCDRKDECPANPQLSQMTECGCELVTDECDDDNDGVRDTEDNCPLTPNSDQADADEDGIGDVCDEYDCKTGSSCDDGNVCTTDDRYDAECNCIGVEGDDDLDGVCNVLDQCQGFPDHKDADSNGIPDGCDVQDECASCLPNNEGRIFICKLTPNRKDFVNISGRCRDLGFLFDEYGDFKSSLYSCGRCECEMIGDTDSDDNGICDSKEKDRD